MPADDHKRSNTLIPEHFHFALGKTDVHEWEIDLETKSITFKHDPGIFSGIEDIRAFIEAVHPEDKDAVVLITERMLLKADTVRYECRFLHGQGDTRWIAVNGCSEGKEGQIVRLYGFTQDITERKRAEAVAQGQRRALELAMTNVSLERILDLLCCLAEEQVSGGLLASILLLDPEHKRLLVAAAPSLPEQYSRSVNGLAIGPQSGSCGAAAFHGRLVIVSDIEHDERWCHHAHLALPHGLKSCWSVPLLSTNGTVQGTMALYSQTNREPSQWELHSISLLSNTASLIIERYKETQERYRAELRFRSLVNATNAIVWTTSKDVEVFTPQEDWVSFTGFTHAEADGMGWLEAIHPDDRENILNFVSRMRQEAFYIQTQVRLRRADGEFRDMELHAVPILDSSGVVKEWAGSYVDITARKQSEKRLSYMATHDGLTDLPNRQFLNEHLQALLDFSPPATGAIAIMLMDFDRFKLINDSMGHEAGDELLRQMAKRLLEELPTGDIVARLGGDEFVVVAHALHGKACAQRLAERLLHCVAKPVHIDGNLLISSASIGICLYPDDGRRHETLIQHADIAMYKAKNDGGNRYRFFSEEMSIAMKNRMSMEIALRGALERHEFVLHYQPRISLPDQRLKGVEALIRWNSPELGLVSPQHFIPIAEEAGIIDEIGVWVLQQACSDIQTLNTQTGLSLCVSVNLSPKQLLCSNLSHKVQNALDLAAMGAELLELELTEGSFIQDMETSTHAMKQLKSIGVTLAIDDFGTGHAGISYLRRFPIDVVKLDRTFITPDTLLPNKMDFMKALTDMAHSLGLHVVAEGVEDEATLNILCQAGCDEAQGYLFAKPLPLHEMVAYAKKYHSNSLL